ncbi:hypothetical protein IC608_11235 [Devosia sp. PTR5]|uniref:TnsA endonuclease N-terminal domain-containing protein n=1 Tax=Devosia oryzisoli TaxID=2774138 RepID=A0A927ITU1_9HYPH|nr:hypothetical protein [Devosia oryzisoli]MBD8066046.1 hypothetical protein [Devosia oryzisoli]
MAAGYERVKRQLEVDQLRTFARIEYMKNGTPIVDLITGREPHVVGTKVCIKAGMRSMPWESVKAERPMINLCEVASPVLRLLAQPHELFMKVTGYSKEWMYRPDLLLTVDAHIVRQVQAGVPFSEAVTQWKPSDRTHDVRLVVEVKDDNDPRIDDPLYERKLQLARQVYEFINWHFVTVVRSHDLDNDRIASSVRQLCLDHDVAISPGDIDRVRTVFGRNPTPMLMELLLELGGGASSLGKCAALHVRRIISIDLRHQLLPESPIMKMPDDMAIFELPGAHPW